VPTAVNRSQVDLRLPGAPGLAQLSLHRDGGKLDQSPGHLDCSIGKSRVPGA
jgi:hypothetical protein